MNVKSVYSTKAEKYAKYRWDYAIGAIEAILEIAQISIKSSVADIGAGTGILTRHFAGKAKRIYVIEPNVEMRQILAGELASFPSISVLDACAESTNLPESSVDLVTVAQAVHWFDPEPARNEIRRILKNDGWMAILKNYSVNEELDKAMSSLLTEEYGADFSATLVKPKERPVQYYFGNHDFQKMTFPFQFQQNWEEFIGAILSTSFMPNEVHPLFRRLENEAKKIFSKYSDSGKLKVQGETELVIGQLSRA